MAAAVVTGCVALGLAVPDYDFRTGQWRGLLEDTADDLDGIVGAATRSRLGIET